MVMIDKVINPITNRPIIVDGERKIFLSSFNSK